jgi:hypothetical protein
VKRRVLAALVLAAALALALDFARVSAGRRALGQLDVPLMHQKEYTEAVCTIDGQKKSVATSGCGAVCIAMAAAALVDSQETPGTLFQWAYDNGMYYGDGLGHEAMSQLAARAGLKGVWLDNRPELILQALWSGRPVAAHMGPGTFTKDGHYILLWGVDDGGLIQVNDPYSAERSQKTYPLDLILGEVKTSRAFLMLEPGADRAVRVF